MNELILWLENEINTQEKFGTQFEKQEMDLGEDHPRVMSTGCYQRAVAHKKCLEKARELLKETT